MTGKNYRVTHAKVDNQDGFRLPSAFFKDFPHLAKASGYLEVVSQNTLLIRLDIEDVESDKEDSLMMSLFLDFIMKDIIQNPSKLVPYTQEMSDYMDDLLADVTIDEDEDE
jgi:antitoxin PrlF